MLERLSPFFSRAVVRAVVIAVVTLFVASALFTPQLNPVTRGSFLASVNVGPVWGELVQWRVAMIEARNELDGWPKDIHQYAPPIANPQLRVTSPRPNVLQADIAHNPELGKLAGTQVVVELKPGTHTWTCRPGNPPIPPGYLPINCLEGSTDDFEPAKPPTHTADADPFAWLRSLILWCGVIFAVGAVVWVVRHPMIGAGQLRPARLRRTPLARLPQIDRLLRWLRRLEPTLLAADIRMVDWRRAVACAQPTGGERAPALARALAERVSARCQPSTDWALPGQVFEWQFPPDLPVSLDRCLVFVPTPGIDEATVLRQLRATQMGSDVLLILSEHSVDTPWPLLRAHADDRANLHVMVDSASQTEWLIGGDALQVLLRQLAAQLRITRISPYQTRGGVTREGAFFGRAQLLARVINREPANYLVVGGRQLGKSSLLKAVQRRMAGHPHTVCHYVSLRDHRLAPRMALQFGLPADTPLEAIVDHLQAQYQGKRLVLLIDEADLFFRDESANGYVQLSTLRALSEEGRCWFMLAGFWDLYATAVLDYQSPLRNFGEVLTIGGLERAACRELATEPLRKLRLGFDNEKLVDRLIDASGQRANLVAILCQECLEALLPGERVIEARHLTQALASQAVQDALAGWGRLSHDEAACRLDRIVVYHTAQAGQTSLVTLAQLLQSHGIAGDAQALRQSLARLQLAYVLRKHEAGEYRFAIPLLQDQFEPTEVELLLHQELAVLGRG
ncbi:AAA domain-containing protein [Acidovorax sp. 94]|uniref:ATP-binding protein n=1 Tax=Acidovorax sp. 94 TaxID=2135633 RepID=UPI000EB2755B|nr:ATP-binding protein [Acidovorax sp. 94]RKR66257.1 AAA domain-containing protein [Acidovorax sp. 94]